MATERPVPDPLRCPIFLLSLDVEDAAGRPLEGATVGVIEHNTVADCCSWPLSRPGHPQAGAVPTTDATGHVSILGMRDLDPGSRYFVSIQHPDHAEGLLDRPEQLPWKRAVVRARVVLAEGHTLDGLLRTERASEGKIATALEDPRIPGCYSVTRLATFDASGRFRITGLNAGTHTLHVSAPGAAPVLLRVRVPLTEPLEITLPAGRRVAGRVLGSDGEPLTGALVSATWPGGYGYRQVETDERGGFVLDGLPADQRLEIEAHRAEPAHLEGLGFTVLEPSFEEVTLTFDARERGTWIGQLFDARTGVPIAHEVGVSAQPRGTRILFRGGGATTDGRFELRLPAGDYALAFEGYGESDASYFARREDARFAAGETSADLRVEASEVFGVEVRILEAATEAPVARAAIAAMPPAPWSRVYLGNTGEDGTFALTPAIDGPMHLTVEAEGFARCVVGRVEITRGMAPVVVRLERLTR